MNDLFQPKAGAFQPIGDVNRRVMSAVQQKAKLKMIRLLDAGEISGWLKARKFDDRPWFPGEMEALRDRAKELGVRL